MPPIELCFSLHMDRLWRKAPSFAANRATRALKLHLNGHKEPQAAAAGGLTSETDGLGRRSRGLETAYSGVKMTEIASERKPRNILEAMWLLARNHPDRYLLTCRRCMRTVLSGTQGGERSFCSNSCRATYCKEQATK